VLPYESLLSHTSIDTKIKEKKRKRILNINLAVLPSYDKCADGDLRELDLETRVTTNGKNKPSRCFTVVH